MSIHHTRFPRSGVLILAVTVILASAVCAQQPSTSTTQPPTKKYQAQAPQTEKFDAQAFGPSRQTTIRWLGSAGFFINSRGTTLMVDPLLEGFDLPMLIDQPILPKDVPRLDAVLVTHADNDHYSKPTTRDLKPVSRQFHSTEYVASLMKKEGLPSTGHNTGDEFAVGQVHIKLTPADHDWQNSFPDMKQPDGQHFEKKDATGFWIETPDGAIWATGDTRLMPEHLHMPTPDAIFFDFSDSEFHLGLNGAIKLANAYPETPLLLCHWGSVYAPEMKEFNGDPKILYGRIINPSRIKLLAPGEPFVLKRVQPTPASQP